MAGTSKANLRQTASNVAATLVAAFSEAGFFQSADGALSEFKSIRDEVFTDLEKQPTATGGGSYSKGSGGSKSQGDPGKVVMNYGKFKGKTIEDVYKMDASEAAAYGYEGPNGEPKTGKQYITWLTKNDNNKFLKDKATQFVESKREAAAPAAAGDGTVNGVDVEAPEKDGEDW